MITLSLPYSCSQIYVTKDAFFFLYFRVYGEKVAEVPLVGTRFQFRRLGMCRVLMDELEKVICYVFMLSMLISEVAVNKFCAPTNKFLV